MTNITAFTDPSPIFYLERNQIKSFNYFLVGIIYIGIKSKKLWDKWSKRHIILTKENLCISKQGKKKKIF